jgi:hypothetical protein
MIKDGRFLSFIAGVLMCTSALAANTENVSINPAKECVAQSEMAAIARDFPQFRNLASADYCLDGSETANLIDSLMFMRKTRFENSMPNSSDELFSGRFAKDWYGYFEGRITDINIQSSCQKGVGAFVYMWGSTMYVCPMLLSANFTSLDRASVMMHEARHIDGYPHTTCRQGARAGLQGACDTKIADGGSYAVSVETYAQIARYAPDVHPALRAYAKSSAVTYADEAFDAKVRIDRDPKFILMTKDLDFVSLDASRGFAVQTLGKVPELGRIVMRAQHMILFPENKANPAKYVFARGEGDIAQQAGDFAADYNSQSPADRAKWVDAFIGAQWGLRVFGDRARFGCDPRSEATRDVSLNGETAKSLLYPNGYDRASKVVQLQTVSGKILDLSCVGGASVKPSTLTLDRGFKRMYRSGAETIGLGDDGKLYRVVGSVSQPVNTVYDGRIHDIAPSSGYKFFD